MGWHVCNSLASGVATALVVVTLHIDRDILRRHGCNQVSPVTIPGDLRTAHLFLRRWCEEDAALLLPILEANAAHLRWIPAHVAAPAPLNEIARRLSEFAADFQAGRSWRFGVFSLDEVDVFGEISLFPRSAEGRVQFGAADRLEIGYWLREDVTGRGYATEATRATASST